MIVFFCFGGGTHMGRKKENLCTRLFFLEDMVCLSCRYIAIWLLGFDILIVKNVYRRTWCAYPARARGRECVFLPRVSATVNAFLRALLTRFIFIHLKNIKKNLFSKCLAKMNLNINFCQSDPMSTTPNVSSFFDLIHLSSRTSLRIYRSVCL